MVPAPPFDDAGTYVETIAAFEDAEVTGWEARIGEWLGYRDCAVVRISSARFADLQVCPAHDGTVVYLAPVGARVAKGEVLATVAMAGSRRP
jgi:hypothetical protein